MLNFYDLLSNTDTIFKMRTLSGDLGISSKTAEQSLFPNHTWLEWMDILLCKAISLAKYLLLGKLLRDPDTGAYGILHFCLDSFYLGPWSVPFKLSNMFGNLQIFLIYSNEEKLRLPVFKET